MNVVSLCALHVRELMLAQRLQRWPNIKATLGERFVFAGVWVTYRNSPSLIKLTKKSPVTSLCVRASTYDNQLPQAWQLALCVVTQACVVTVI